jgi:hypothetical protein
MLFALAGHRWPGGEQMKLSSMATCLNLILAIASSSACSQVVANTGISSVGELRDGRNRNEVRAQYGSPVSSTTLPTGREVETYRVRKQLDRVFSAMSNNSWVHRQNPLDSMGRDTLLCLLLGPGCLYILVHVVGSETVSLPVNLVRSQMNQIEVAFVFGTDDELLYVYEAAGDPSTRFSQAIRPLQHPLRSEGDSGNTTIGERLAEYIAEARGRSRALAQRAGRAEPRTGSSDRRKHRCRNHHKAGSPRDAAL